MSSMQTPGSSSPSTERQSQHQEGGNWKFKVILLYAGSWQLAKDTYIKPSLGEKDFKFEVTKSDPISREQKVISNSETAALNFLHPLP